MNRKNFIASVGAALAAMPFSKPLATALPQHANWVAPPFLKPGDMIGITSPAGYIMREEIIPAATLMQQWGFKIRVGSTIGKRNFTFGGTDEERLQDMQQMLDDPQIKAILCARGGYGCIRIVDALNWTKFKAQPKWVIGFSDVTVLHTHINKNWGIATIHSKMCNSFPDVWDSADALQKDTILSIQKALCGQKMKYQASFNSYNRTGKTQGVLLGGNLKIIESLAGSVSDINTDNKILFVEDTGEYLYSVDRMFWNLKRTRKLSKLAALIVGGIKTRQDAPGEYFGKTIYDIISEIVKEYRYPVCFDFPVGHQIDNFALKCGAQYQLSVTAEGTTLQDVL